LIALYISMIRLQKVQELQEHRGSLVLTWTPTDLKKVNQITCPLYMLLTSLYSYCHFTYFVQLGNLVARNLSTRRTTRNLCRRFVLHFEQDKIYDPHMVPDFNPLVWSSRYLLRWPMVVLTAVLSALATSTLWSKHLSVCMMYVLTIPMHGVSYFFSNLRY
jgi:hypothetical protein